MLGRKVAVHIRKVIGLFSLLCAESQNIIVQRLMVIILSYYCHHFEIIMSSRTTNVFSGRSVTALQTSVLHHFSIKAVVEVKASGPRQILWLWLG